MVTKHKIRSIAGYLMLWVIYLIPFHVTAQITTNEEEIPYGISDGDFSIVYDKFKLFTYGDYVIEREGYVNPGLTPYIEAKGMREINYTGIGAGIDVRFPILYALIHKNTKRLRVADDFGLGTFLSTNKITMKDALTDTDLKYDQNKSSKSPVNYGITFYYGIQAVYRISNTVDIGLRFIPLYGTGDSKITNTGTTFGLHARINRFYIDYRITPSASYTRSKNAENTFESNGAKYVCVKYAIAKKSYNGYLFASLNSYTYQVNDTYGNGETFIPAGYENYTPQKNH